MCTVLFIPDSNGVCITSLRDEHFSRPSAMAPALYRRANSSFIAPKDTLANGTWCGVREDGGVIVLLNGAFENHARKSFYRKSRGLIVWELLESENPLVLWNELDLTDIEPFTLVVYFDLQLHQLTWDGELKHQLEFATNEPHLWSSSTLYTAEAKEKKTRFFMEWFHRKSDRSFHAIYDFFHSVIDPQDGFLINRKGVMKTVSYTWFYLENESTAYAEYKDMQTHDSSRISMSISPQQ